MDVDENQYGVNDNDDYTGDTDNDGDNSKKLTVGTKYDRRRQNSTKQDTHQGMKTSSNNPPHALSIPVSRYYPTSRDNAIEFCLQAPKLEL